jgi:hypothetical protein
LISLSVTAGPTPRLFSAYFYLVSISSKNWLRQALALVRSRPTNAVSGVSKRIFKIGDRRLAREFCRLQAKSRNLQFRDGVMAR